MKWTEYIVPGLVIFGGLKLIKGVQQTLAPNSSGADDYEQEYDPELITLSNGQFRDIIDGIRAAIWGGPLTYVDDAILYLAQLNTYDDWVKLNFLYGEYPVNSWLNTIYQPMTLVQTILHFFDADELQELNEVFADKQIDFQFYIP